MRRRWLRRGILILAAAAVSAIAGILVSNNGGSTPKDKDKTSASTAAMTLATLPDIQLMGLMAPGDGWAANGVHLYFTRHNGLHWSMMLTSPVAGDLLNNLDGFASIGRNDLWFGSYLRGYGTCSQSEAPANSSGAIAVPVVRFTTNAGNTWRRTSLPRCGLITGIDFLNSTHGSAFIANDRSESIVSTSDGGDHWRYVGTLPVRASIDLSSLEDGWATAVSGDAAYAITNGGATWHALVLPLPNAYRAGDDITLTPPKFFGTKIGVIGAEMSDDSRSTAIVFKTMDGGENWTASVLPDHAFDANGIVVGQLSTIEPFAGLGPNTWIFYLGPKLYETTDGGRTCSSFLPKSPWLENATTSLDFVSPSSGWVIQWLGDAALAFLRTTNGGRTGRRLRMCLVSELRSLLPY